MESIWDKPVMIFYKERKKQPERKAFLVVKARELIISIDEKKEREIKGKIVDFFPLMGDSNYLSSDIGLSDTFVLCWFDNKEVDINKSWRKLIGVTLDDKAKLSVDERNKKTYNLYFKAKKGNL